MKHTIARLFLRLSLLFILSLITLPVLAQVLNAPRLSKRITATGNVHLGWIDNNSATDKRFAVERRVGITGEFQQIATVAPELRSYVDKGTQAGTTYQYRIRTFRSNIYSGYSNTVRAKLPTTTPMPTQPPVSTTPEPTPTAGVLMYSYEANLANGRALSGATLDRRVVYLYLSNPSLYKSVNFYCCKGLAGAASGESHLEAVLDQSAPFSHSVDLAQLKGGTRELYVDAMKVGTSTYDNISTTFILKDGVIAPAPAPTPTPSPTPNPTPTPPSDPTATKPSNAFYKVINFNEGSNGSLVAGYDFHQGSGKESSTRYQCGAGEPRFEGTCSAKMIFREGIGATGHSEIDIPATLPGQTLYFSMQMYIPQGSRFIAGPGSLKFLGFYNVQDNIPANGRLWFNLQQGAFSSASNSLIYMQELGPARTFGTGSQIRYNAWNSFQASIRVGAGDGAVQFYVNNALVYSENNIRTAQTVNGATLAIRTLMLFHYWNDSRGEDRCLSDDTVYVDDIVFTNDPTRTVKDAQGNRYVGPR